MSNLLKQYYVVNESSGQRVINSNLLVEDRIKKIATYAKVPSLDQIPNAMQATDMQGFAEGLEAKVVELPPEPDPKEVAQKILAEARAQADQMLNDARANAAQIIEEANENAARAFEEQKQLGYEQGVLEREQELAEMEKELQDELQRVQEEVGQKQIELESEYQMHLEEMEESIVDALIPVFDKVFHIQLEGQREILLSLIKNVLLNVEVGNKVKIRVNEADKEMLSAHIDEVIGMLGKDVTLELVLDMKLADGQCQVETNYGVYDCGIDTQYTNLIKAIRALI